MKKLLCVLLCSLISIGVYSQKITNLRKCRNAYNEHYVEVTIFNSSYSHYIVCVVLAMQYIDIYGRNAESTLTISDKHFRSRTDSYINIYKKPDGCMYVKRLYVKRVIYDNGNYIDFK